MGVGAATAEAVEVSTEEVAVFTAAVLLVDFTGEASAVALSTAALVSVGDVSADAVSTAVVFVVAVLVGATFAITDSLTMSSSAASAFRHGGAGAIHTDITDTTITLMLTMDTADTVTMVGPVTDTAMAVDQGISGVRGAGDKLG